MWKIQWTDDEVYSVRLIGSEILVHKYNAFGWLFFNVEFYYFILNFHPFYLMRCISRYGRAILLTRKGNWIGGVGGGEEEGGRGLIRVTLCDPVLFCWVVWCLYKNRKKPRIFYFLLFSKMKPHSDFFCFFCIFIYWFFIWMLNCNTSTILSLVKYWHHGRKPVSSFVFWSYRLGMELLQENWEVQKKNLYFSLPFLNASAYPGWYATDPTPTPLPLRVSKMCQAWNKF